MRLYLEGQDAVQGFENSFDAKEELVNVLEGAQEAGQSFSPIEIAALHMTMERIDPEFNLPAIEQYHLSSELYTTLATESLKENIKGKWEAFVKAIKKILKQLRDFIANSYQRIKSKFKRKAGDKNDHFKRGKGEEEAEPEMNEGDTGRVEPDSGESSAKKKIPTEYTMDRCWLDMDDEASIDSLKRRMKYTAVLMTSVVEISDAVGGMQTSILQTLANTALTENLEKVAKANAQATMDVLNDLGGYFEGRTVNVDISETVRIMMPLEDINSFPSFEIKKGNMVTIEAPTMPNERAALGKELHELNVEIVNKAERFYKEVVNTHKDEVKLDKVTDPEARKIIMKLGKMYTLRIRFIRDMSDLVNGATDIAGGMAADLLAL